MKNGIRPENNHPIRTRIAPSPTGFLHIGTARTALFNYLFAKHNGGKFYLRIEDTDLERSKLEFEKEIIESLKWLGLSWDGEIVKQSQRTEIYRKYIKKLLENGNAFWCYHTKEELEKEKEDLKNRGLPQVHFCEHKNTLNEQAAMDNDQSEGVIRLKCPNDEKIKFYDLIRGEIEFNTNQIGDIVIAKNEKTPLYNLAVVIDDCEMKMTHIIRGEDHVSNTPKQILILQALDILLPQYAHIPLTLAPDRSKLSKRHGAVAIGEYKELGYLSEALINFMAFLGWNPGDSREVFSLEELVEEFAIEKMQKSAAIFNIEKLDWFNAQYVRQMNIKELVQRCVPFLEKKDLIQKAGERKYKIRDTNEVVGGEWIEKIIKLEQERIKKLSEMGELTDFFFKDVLEYDASLLKWKNMEKEEIKTSLDKAYNLLSNLADSDFSEQKLEGVIMPEAKALSDRGRLLWPLRVALSGKKASPGPFAILSVLGKEKALKRIKGAIEKA